MQFHSFLKQIVVFWGLFQFLLPVFAQPQAPNANAVKNLPTLSVLALTELIDPKIVEDFTKNEKMSVRVEYVNHRRDLVLKMRSAPQLWDVVVGEARDLNQLIRAGLLRRKTDLHAEEKEESGKVGGETLSEEEELNLFLVNPLVVAWKQNTRKSTEPVTWENLTQVEQNPLWRGRVFLPSDARLQWRIVTLGAPQKKDVPFHFEQGVAWWRMLRRQNFGVGKVIAMEAASNRATAFVVWLKEFVHLKRIVRNLDFAVPGPRTIYEAYAVGVTGRSENEEKSKIFLDMLIKRQQECATYSGLLPAQQISEDWTSMHTLPAIDLETDKKIKSEVAKSRVW